MRPTLVYTAARLAIFVVALVVIYLIGARGLVAIALAVLVSGLISFIALSRQRDAMSRSIVGKMREFGTRIDEGARVEDEAAPDAETASGDAASTESGGGDAARRAVPPETVEGRR